MPRKKKPENNENNNIDQDIQIVKKKIEDVANEYKKYLFQMGPSSGKDDIITNKFMDDFKKEQPKQTDKFVYEVPLIDLENAFGPILDNLPNDELRDKFYTILEDHGLRININDGTIELLIYD